MKLVDTSAWVEFLRRRGDPIIKQAVAQLLQADQAALTCPIRFELSCGVRPGEEDDLQQVLTFAQLLPFEGPDWDAAAEIERLLRKKGLTVPRDDLFVACIAIRYRIPVLCRDAHFDDIRRTVGARLEVEQL